MKSDTIMEKLKDRTWYPITEDEAKELFDLYFETRVKIRRELFSNISTETIPKIFPLGERYKLIDLLVSITNSFLSSMACGYYMISEGFKEEDWDCILYCCNRDPLEDKDPFSFQIDFTNGDFKEIARKTPPEDLLELTKNFTRKSLEDKCEDLEFKNNDE